MPKTESPEFHAHFAQVRHRYAIDLPIPSSTETGVDKWIVGRYGETSYAVIRPNRAVRIRRAVAGTLVYVDSENAGKEILVDFLAVFRRTSF